ncbi:hypothetical protein LOTGIDRAFT_165019 [Lottia gigantea]|uniref:Platelet-derived growth factor (PDGF) family profile domain-containing protein n=1 Tax=Lottia gigantea TaxID=225164 RepID=V3ZE76_LOTGI|nr:hypothetical protein LOTGIDRAFT_165019 [Lottia gigantea]ESO89423.1 hypothetical protein LOTGIDRAFT_165019 [Lottia gigantea]
MTLPLVNSRGKKKGRRFGYLASKLFQFYPTVQVQKRRASYSVQQADNFQQKVPFPELAEYYQCHHCRQLQSGSSFNSSSTSLSPSSSSTSSSSSAPTWNRMRVLRLLGQCVLLVLFATCTGIIFNKTLDSDYDSIENVNQFVDSEVLTDMTIQTLSMNDFHNSIRRLNKSYDIIRIFLQEKDISDDQIHELLAARTMENLLTGKSEKKRENSDDYDFEFDYEDEKMAIAGTNMFEEELSEAYHHMEEMETSPMSQCKYPQPEIVHVEAENHFNRMLYPECTILYRCRNTSGCCGNKSQECGPKYLQVVKKTFLVLSVSEKGGTVRPHETLLETRTFINHTECGCKERKGLPGCHQECPFPFVKFRPELRCICDCLEGENEENIICRTIKDGLYPLTEKDLECIKSGKCMTPECTVKESPFQIRTGFCPEISVDELGRKGYINAEKQNKPKNKKKNRHEKKKRRKYRRH